MWKSPRSSGTESGVSAGSTAGFRAGAGSPESCVCGRLTRAPGTDVVPVVASHCISRSPPSADLRVCVLNTTGRLILTKSLGKVGWCVRVHVLTHGCIANGPRWPKAGDVCSRNHQHHHQWKNCFCFFCFLGELKQAERLLPACMPHPGPSPPITGPRSE